MVRAIAGRAVPAGATLLLAGALFGGGAAGLGAQAAGPDVPNPEARSAIAALRSPFCPGLMLEVCPSPEAAALRDSIETLADAGWSSDRLVEWMIDNHGEEYRAVPRASGTGLWAWIVPPLGLLLGLAGVLFALRRLRDRTGPARVERELSSEETARVEAALARLEDAERGSPLA